MKPTSGAAHAALSSKSKNTTDAYSKNTTTTNTLIYHGLRGQVQKLITAPWFSTFIMVVIIANTISLGIDTIKTITDLADGLVRHIIQVLDTIFLTIFVIEIVLRFFVQRLSYFKDGWNWFDLIVVGIALVPTGGGLSALRAIRVIRALRLLSLLPSMRAVVDGLVQAIPGMFSAMVLLGLIHYVYAVIGVHMFSGQTYGGYMEGKDYFENLGEALYTLFQIMTLESWSHGIVRPILDEHPGFITLAYFISFVILSAFAALNLFIGIIVNAMDTLKHEEEMKQSAEDAADPAQQAILCELRALREEVSQLKKYTRIP